MENFTRTSRNHIAKLQSKRFMRFIIVGVANTLINFAVLNLSITVFDNGKILSAVIATSCAIIFSFIFNRSFVFVDKERPVKKFLVFIVISVVGVLLIQVSVYAFFVWVLQSTIYNETALVNISNLIASLSVALWNYNGYRLLVFTDIKHKSI